MRETLTVEGGRPRLVLFPGLGADRRLFGPQMGLQAEVEVPGWIEPAGRWEPLGEYARRLAGTIGSERPFWVGGVSFGGMVAMEVARRVPCCGVILISSCRSWAGLPAVARVGRWVVPWVPARVAYVAKALACPVRLVFGAGTREQVGLFREMLRDTPPEFLRWSLCQALSWGGVGDLGGVPVYQIHGARDRVIPCPREGVDEVVAGAGHLMSWTHAEAVNRFIMGRIGAGQAKSGA